MKNKVLMTFMSSVFALSFICFSLTGQSTKTPENNQKEKQYDIAAFVWPSYHPDDRAKIFWPDGIGEWQTVMTNKPRYEGHEQPRYPLWGYINEADPYVAEMEINAAADHGVNVFIFDWYWYDGMPFLEGHSSSNNLGLWKGGGQHLLLFGRIVSQFFIILNHHKVETNSKIF